MKDNDLAEFVVGGWKLEAWTINYADGRTTWPFGKQATGQILYASDGYMSATIMGANRKKLTSANVRDASTLEQAQAFLSYFHYAGSWEVEGSYVLHRVELALNPNSLGSTQKRFASSENKNQLILSAQELVGADETRTHKIEWRRAKPKL